MQRQASSNISSHSCGLSIRTVTLKLILLRPPPPPLAAARGWSPIRRSRAAAATRGRHRRKPPRRHRRQRACCRPTRLPGRRGCGRLWSAAGWRCRPGSRRGMPRGRSSSPPALGLGVPAAIRVIRLPLSWMRVDRGGSPAATAAESPRPAARLPPLRNRRISRSCRRWRECS